MLTLSVSHTAWSLYRYSIVTSKKPRFGHSCRKFSLSAMDQTTAKNSAPLAVAKSEESGQQMSDLLQGFFGIPNIEKAWINVLSEGKGGMDVVVAMSQVNLHVNGKRTFMSSVFIPDVANNAADYHWSPFPFELSGALLISPSPSGTKLFIVRKSDVGTKDGSSPVKLEIWGPGQLLMEFIVPPAVHGSVYVDGWFEGVSWSHNEEYIAYVAEEPLPPRPIFGQPMFWPGPSSRPEGGNDAGTWKGQGDWVEDWGESYSGKSRPVLFVASIASGTVQIVEGIPKDVSAGQVVWSPPSLLGSKQLLVFVGWPSYATNFGTARKLGMKYCFNRPCALYAVESPFSIRDSTIPSQSQGPVKLTVSLSSALSPRFSPDGKLLAFLSAKAAVDSGAHCATNSLHAIRWPTDGASTSDLQIEDVVPVVMQPELDAFPGLYCWNLISQPWLSDGSTLLLSSSWRSTKVILAVNIESGTVTRISPQDSKSSWTILSLYNDFIISVESSPISPHCLKLGSLSNINELGFDKAWNWLDICLPPVHLAEKVESALKSMAYEILSVPVPASKSYKMLSEGAKQPFEALFISSKSCYRKSGGGTKRPESIPPLLLVLHGGPHSVADTSFSRTAAFLSALGFNLLTVNYRGSLGFGEEALQSLPGHVGRQDVADSLAALNLVIAEGLAEPTKVAVMGGSHGGFLASHLIGQAPDQFLTAVLRNPVCNVSSMIGVSDIPDWCYVESFGKEGLSAYSEAPSLTDLTIFYKVSPIAHLSKVKVPTLVLLGAQDRRVPVSNGLQYVQALRARGLEVKVIVFPEDVHAVDRPQSEFESFLNIGIWLKRFFSD